MNKNMGALWIKTSKNGNKFFSGVVEMDGKKKKIVIFKNNRKEKDNQPDYQIFESQPMGQENNASCFDTNDVKEESDDWNTQ